MNSQDSNLQIKKCGSCRFWGISQRFSEEDIKDDIYKPCGRIYHDKDSRHKKNQFPWEPEDFEENQRLSQELLEEGHKAVVIDGSGYFASLLSSETFSCDNYEEK